MKFRKLACALMAAGLLGTLGTAQAGRFQIDPTQAGIGVSGIEPDGTSPSMDQMGFNASSDITVSDGNADGVFNAGDTFTESGTFSINSFINLPGTSISPVNLNNTYKIFGTFTGISGEITNVVPDANAITGADYVAFDFDRAGTLDFYIDVAGGTGPGVHIASASVSGGSGNIFGDFGLGAPSSNPGLADQGSIDLVFEFTWMLDQFWLWEDGRDIEDIVSSPYRMVMMLTDMNVDNSSTVATGTYPVFFTLETTHNGSLMLVPEPSMVALLGLGLLGAAGFRNRKKA